MIIFASMFFCFCPFFKGNLENVGFVFVVLMWIYLKLSLISNSVFARHLQTEDSVHQLEGEFRTVISALRSKLDSRAAPPILHLDTVDLQEEPPKSPPSPTSSTGAPVHTSPSSSSQESQQPWSLVAALMNEIEKLRTQDEIVTEDASQSETSSNRDGSTDVKWSSASEDFTFVENGDRTELKSSALPLPVQSTTVGQPVTEMTADPGQTVHAVKTLSLHRKYRSLLRKRQIPGASGKSMCQHAHFSQDFSEIFLQNNPCNIWIDVIPQMNVFCLFL